MAVIIKRKLNRIKVTDSLVYSLRVERYDLGESRVVVAHTFNKQINKIRFRLAKPECQKKKKGLGGRRVVVAHTFNKQIKRIRLRRKTEIEIAQEIFTGNNSACLSRSSPQLPLLKR